MGTYRQIYYQIVIGTKGRKPTISEEYCSELYKYMRRTLENHQSFVYAINGVADHLHIVCDIHPTKALADVVKSAKVACSLWMKQHGGFPMFEGWADGYGAFTYSHFEKGRVIAYVEQQKEHHRKVHFLEEYRSLLERHGIAFDERYLL